MGECLLFCCHCCSCVVLCCACCSVSGRLGRVALQAQDRWREAGVFGRGARVLGRLRDTDRTQRHNTRHSAPPHQHQHHTNTLNQPNQPTAPHLVRARQQQRRHADDVARGDARRVRRGRLHRELVAAGHDRADERRVQDLVERLVLGGADVDDAPLQIVFERREALVLHLELDVVAERRGVVLDVDRRDRDLGHGGC